LLRESREAISTLPLSVRILESGNDKDGVLTFVECKDRFNMPAGVSISCRPAMLATPDAKDLSSDQPIDLKFGPHALESVSSFVAFRVSAKVGSVEQTAAFVCNLPLIDAPENRREKLLRSLVKDTKTLLRFLMLLLSDDPEGLSNELRRQTDDSGRGGPSNSDQLPLLEQMLAALANSPEKLEQVQRLIKDLAHDSDGGSLLPQEFTAVWEPILQVCEATQKSVHRQRGPR